MFFLHRDYTTLFEPIVIDDDDEIEYFTEDKKQDLPPEEHLLVILIFCIKLICILVLNVITLC